MTMPTVEMLDLPNPQKDIVRTAGLSISQLATSSIKSLTKLPGIGKVTAKRIIEQAQNLTNSYLANLPPEPIPVSEEIMSMSEESFTFIPNPPPQEIPVSARIARIIQAAQAQK